jgi:hypothetical protein
MTRIGGDLPRSARRPTKAARIAIGVVAACAFLVGAVGAAEFVEHQPAAPPAAQGTRVPPLPTSSGRHPGGHPGGLPPPRSFHLPGPLAPHGARPAAPGSSPAPAPAPSRALNPGEGVTAPSGHGGGQASAQGSAPAFAVTYVKPGTSLTDVSTRTGGTYAFKRGATYTGTLRIAAVNVTIEAYGSGQDPVFSRRTEGSLIVVSGNEARISHVRLTGHGYQPVPGCGSARTAGYEIGIDLTGDQAAVDAVHAYGNLYAGIYVESSASYATISHSVFDHVNSLNPGNFGSGAFGVLLWGDHNTLKRDVFANQSTCSPQFGRDGSGVEVYHGSHNMIKYNTGWNDVDFTELGGAGATGNVYLNNKFYAPGEFLVTRGSGDHADGPVKSTVLIGNVAHGAVVSYDWRRGEGPLLIMRDNHISRLSQDGGFINKGGLVIGF